MFNAKAIRLVGSVLVLWSIAGCTVHPAGEREERSAATRAGEPFKRPIESRQLPELSANATPEQMAQYAALANAELEQRYWEWRAAIEQIPQDGTQSTTFNVAAGTTLTRGQANLQSSTVALANDPMTDIKWPGKLDAAAKQTLENARAAGRRFRKAQFELRAKVLNAYYDYALNAELIRLEQKNQQLLRNVLSVTQSRSGVGSAGQQDVLKAANELDLSANDIANMQSQLPAERAAINAILSRPPQALIAIPEEMPTGGSFKLSDDSVLSLAARQNPELQALSDEIKGREDGIRLAKLQYIPDFNLSVGTDLMGISQSILGQATIPVFRYEALNAAIAQAQANLQAAEAMRRQTSNDLSAEIVLDITTVRDAERQLDLLSHSIRPRSQRAVVQTRTAYESGQATFLDLLDSERSLISIDRLIANLRVIRAKRLAEIESITGGSVT
ncbi:MAG: TolC family protein [Planctomycetota bacterium]|nr:TolC family protein [Planctomycetota bacterium]